MAKSIAACDCGDRSPPRYLDPGKIPKPIDVGERLFSLSELKNASDFDKFHPPACSYRTGTPANSQLRKNNREIMT